MTVRVSPCAGSQLGSQQFAVVPVRAKEHRPTAGARTNLYPNLLSLWPACGHGDIYFAILQWSFPSHKIRINDIFANAQLQMHKQHSAFLGLPCT